MVLFEGIGRNTNFEIATHSLTAHADPCMFRIQRKTGYFVLEGLNSFATVYYAYYLYFFMQEVFGFGNTANLTLAAVNGLVCMGSAWWAGRFAQRKGYVRALKCGFSIMAGALLVGSQLISAAGQVFTMALYIFGMCFTWPTLEALVSQNESPSGLQQRIGIYNIVWASTAAIAYFSGGAMLDKLGLHSMFYVPAAIHLVQIILTFFILPRLQQDRAIPAVMSGGQESVQELRRPALVQAKKFMRLAWLANPLGYIAINTLIAVIPGLARNYGLSATMAGFFCSLWCFARVAAFVALWQWTDWHYRFRWLAAAYVSLILAFAGILMVHSIIVLIVAQIFFGLALGLLYYSSLFYSMDVGEAGSEHSGIHEAVIGFGNFVGPAVGAASLYLVPEIPRSGAFAVCGVLVLGFVGMIAVWQKRD